MEENVAFFVRCRAPTGDSTAASAMLSDYSIWVLRCGGMMVSDDGFLIVSRRMKSYQSNLSGSYPNPEIFPSTLT